MTLMSLSESPSRIPYALSGFGLLLGLVLLGEVGSLILNGFYSASGTFYLGVITSSPFILGLIFSGYWIKQSGLDPERYDRIATWWSAGTLVTVVVIFIINSTIRPITTTMIIETLRWSGAIGGGIGLLLGVFQAQAIEKAIQTERARLRQQELQQRLEVAQMGQALTDIEPIQLSEVVRGWWEKHAPAESTLRIDCSVGMLADQDRIEEMFDQLLDNAIKHGGQDVSVRVGLLNDSTGFYVEDDGPGIPTQKRRHVREIAPENNSMGIAVVDQIASEHGWTLTITESSSGGARFEITGVTITETG